MKLDLYTLWSRNYRNRPIPHPDFDAWEVGHGNKARFLAVESFIRDNNAGVRVLDMGCNYGHLLYSLIKSGAVATGDAFDFAELPFRVASLVLAFVGVTPKKMDAREFMVQVKEPYSTICAMSLVYHFIETYPLGQAQVLIKSILGNCGYFIFDDAPVVDTWPVEAQGGICAFIESQTDKKAKVIGKDTEFHRVIYAIEGNKK